MQIRVLTLFKHGHDTYHKDDVRTVPDDEGAYFVAHGWAVRNGDATPPEPPAQPPVTLDVQNVVLHQGVQDA